ncbi:hypothetical protein OGAPHI_001178 [Ogataea philodendri]|uniref:D-lactate dehydrogenase (cytochrome) n=2 Tax=Saccharomycotina TaxID=147537 RepID=A0A9P8PE89_9ASCO|nr:uncharacterized protein OGAPHI_001178 [Ogataea philodendri]KAH3670663.1 hypothetical protein OGAPHI_001178 [Ogataea philodendri]
MNLFRQQSYKGLRVVSRRAGRFRRFNSTQNGPQESPKATGSRSGAGSGFLKTGGIFVLGSILGAGYVSVKVGSNVPEFLFPQSSTSKLNDLLSPEYGDADKAIDELTVLLGPSKITNTKISLDDHSDTFWSTHHAEPDQRPVAVVYPESTEEVSEIMKICHKNKVPVVPFSGGTSLEGQFIPTRRGICLDLSKMNKIIELHKEDLDVVVQAAVGWEDLRDHLADYNLMFGPDPGVSTNAARYGTMKENVAGLTVVLADGTIVKTKKRPRKSAAGYNLTGLFIGSEGTLGIVTEATLKLHVKPRFENVLVVSFPTLTDAANTVAQLVQRAIPANAIELLDDRMMQFVNFSGETSLKYDELPTLMLKVGGDSKDSAQTVSKTIKEIAKAHNYKSLRVAESEEEKFELWNARKVALWSCINYGKKTIDDNIQVWTTDVAVPISRLCKSLQDTKDDIDKAGLTTAILGHVGDGNYHAVILFKKDQYDLCKKVVQRMVDRALEAEGTVTGEHGVGYGKRDYLVEELGEDAIDLMRKIKLALDPNRILNPDKVFKIDPQDPDVLGHQFQCLLGDLDLSVFERDRVEQTRNGFDADVFVVIHAKIFWVMNKNTA